MKNLTPYVGVTGLVNENEVEQTVSLFEEYSFSSHIPMLGFLVSYKTLNHIPTKNKRYLKIEVIPKLLTSIQRKGVFPAIYYNSRENGFFN